MKKLSSKLIGLFDKFFDIDIIPYWLYGVMWLLITSWSNLGFTFYIAGLFTIISLITISRQEIVKKRAQFLAKLSNEILEKIAKSIKIIGIILLVLIFMVSVILFWNSFKVLLRFIVGLLICNEIIRFIEKIEDSNNKINEVYEKINKSR